jgi:hypothetical protein
LHLASMMASSSEKVIKKVKKLFYGTIIKKLCTLSIQKVSFKNIFWLKK